LSVAGTTSRGRLRTSPPALRPRPTSRLASALENDTIDFDGAQARREFITASFWSAERSRKVFGPGDYREGWFLLDDDAVELDEPIGWEPLTSDCAWFENDTVSLPAATGERLTCREPLSAGPITATVLASMQIMINRLLRSLVPDSA